MTKVLISTIPTDAHAVYVKLALQKMGHEAVLWYSADMPQQQTHALTIDKAMIRWRCKGKNININDEKFDAVWFRRARKPILPEDLHPDDIDNAENQNITFYKTIWQVICQDSIWVNPLESSAPVNCKLKQLEVAAKVGLNIPNTLISNDPEAIKDFINGNDRVIFKTLFPTIWSEISNIRLTYTKEIAIDQIPSNAVLRVSPSIFQKKIEKAFELRVTYFGKKAIAVKINSQDHPKGLTDWRYIPTHELSVEEYPFPEEVNRKCLSFMMHFNLLFGCFDFIVTPDNEYYFLEINEQGQFLWVEEVNPNIKMLDAFTNFIINPKGLEVKSNTDGKVSLNDFKEIAVTELDRIKNDHIDIGIMC